MKTEQTFMMVFRYAPQQNQEPTEKELNEMSQDWGQFIGNLAIKEKLVSTEQLGFEGVQILPNSSIIEEVYTNDTIMVSGTMVVKANSIQEATELAKKCPVLKMGGTVEVRTIIPMSI